MSELKDQLLKLADKITEASVQKDWTAQLHPPERQSMFDFVVLKVSRHERQQIVAALVNAAHNAATRS